MLNTVSRSWLIGGWSMTIAVIVAASMAIGANLSTSALLLGLGAAAAIITLMIGGAAASPSVAEILNDINTKDSSA